MDNEYTQLLHITNKIQLCLGCIFGYLGNISVCAVIFFSKSIQTPINYYILNLAIANILIITCHLLSWLHNDTDIVNENFKPALCITFSLVWIWSSYARLFTVTVMSIIVGYKTISMNFIQVYRVCKVRRNIIVLVNIWVFGFLINLPKLYGILYRCTISKTEFFDYIYYEYVASVIYFTLDIIIFSFIGVLCFYTNKEFQKMKMSCNVPQSTYREEQENYKVFKVLVMIAIALFVCGTPRKICDVLLFHYYKDGFVLTTDRIHNINTARIITTVFFHIFTVINPLIYIIYWDRFRNGFKNTLARMRGGRSEEFSSGQSPNEDIRMDVQN